SEPNDSAASANGPVGASPVAAAISSATDADWYRFTVPADATVTISVDAAGSADLDWYLYDASDTATQLARGYTAADPEVGTYAAPAGTYLVKVNGYRGATASYTLQIVAN